jgi:ferredoxin
MQAITVQNAAEIDLDRCIGCGVCVNGCEFEALHLGPKHTDAVYEPPKNVVETYMNMARERMEDA